jgi:hypothetical protein
MKLTFTRCVLFASLFACAIISVQSDAAQLTVADGMPWKMTASGLPGGTITMNPDGTGTMGAGFMSMKISWTQNGSFTCIRMGSMGDHCVKFVTVAGGFDGTEHGSKRKMLLRRN